MRWKRTTEEWELLVEALQDKLEAEHEKRLEAEDKADQLAAELGALREAACLIRLPPSSQADLSGGVPQIC
jgi:hypothetical protein